MNEPRPVVPTALLRTGDGPAFLASFLALLLACLYLAGRMWFDDAHLAPALLSLGTSWFLIHFPFGIRVLAFRTRLWPGPVWWFGDGILSLLGLGLVAALGRLGEPVGVPIAVGGPLLLGLRLGVVRPPLRWRAWLGCGAAATLLGVGLAGAVWGRGMTNPAFLEVLSRGEVTRDTLFHASLCNMLRTYGVPSYGVDGLVPCHYHFGSHLLFAQLCDLLGISAVVFYQVSYAVIVLPLLAQALCAAGTPTVSPADPAPSVLPFGPTTWAVLFLILLGVTSDPHLWKLYWPRVHHSESATLAVVLLLFAFAAARPVVLAWWSAGYRLRRSERVAAAVAFPTVVVLLLCLKISVGALVLAGGGCLYLRTRGARSSALATASLALAGAASYLILPIIQTEISPYANAKMKGFFDESLRPEYVEWFFLAHTVWLLAAVIVRLRAAGAGTVGDVVLLVRSGRVLDLEFVAVLTAGSFAAAYVLPIGFDATWFLYLPEWLACACFLSAVNTPSRAPPEPVPVRVPWWERVRRRPVVDVLSWAAVLYLLWEVATHTAPAVYTAADDVLCGCGFAPSPTAAQTPERAELKRLLLSGRLKSTADRIEAQTGVGRDDPRRATVALLRTLDDLPVERKRETVLYIPRSNRAYWDLLHPPPVARHGRMAPLEWSAPLVAPALSGLAVLDGLPAPDPRGGWVYAAYPRYRQPHPYGDGPEHKDELCARAGALGFSRVLILAPDPDGRPRLIEWCLGDARPVLK